MSKRILLVDDACFMRMMLKDIFTKNGYEICGEASNGIEAIDKVKELNPDLVTLDVTMPEMDGITTLKNIKKINPNINVIMCSAMGQQSIVIEALQLGAKDFIVKPFQANLVIESVSKIIG